MTSTLTRRGLERVPLSLLPQLHSCCFWLIAYLMASGGARSGGEGCPGEEAPSAHPHGSRLLGDFSVLPSVVLAPVRSEGSTLPDDRLGHVSTGEASRAPTLLAERQCPGLPRPPHPQEQPVTLPQFPRRRTDAHAPVSSFHPRLWEARCTGRGAAGTLSRDLNQCFHFEARSHGTSEGAGRASAFLGDAVTW